MLKFIKLPSTLTYIGQRSFENTQLESVVFPNSLITIDNEAFRLNSNLRNILFGEENNDNSNSENFQNAPSLKYIGKDAFANCEKLNNVRLQIQLLKLMIMHSLDVLVLILQ